jgi:hypothetical protein
MCDPDAEGAKPPLGWALSEAAQRRISSYLSGTGDGKGTPSCQPENAEGARMIAKLLAGSKSPAAGGDQ